MSLHFRSSRFALVSAAAVTGTAMLAVAATAASAPPIHNAAFRVAHPAISQGMKPAIAAQGYDCTTGTAAPFYCLGGENDSAQNGFTYGVYGVEGYAPHSNGGVGVLGYSGSPSVSNAYGVYGVSFSPKGIGVYGAGDGPMPASGAPPSTATQSTGVVGDSHSGVGVFGSTEFPNDSSPLGNNSVAAGVEGNDLSGSGHNAGVVGNTTTGFAGVVGNATSKTGNNDSYGVAGASNNTGGNSAGVYGSGAVFGTYGIGTAAGSVGVGDGIGAIGVSSYTYAVAGGFGTLSNAGGAFDGNYVGVFGESPNPTPPGIDTYGLALVNETSGNYTFLVDYEGDTYATGTAHSDEVTRDPQQRVRAFVPTSTRATTEDYGEGHLVAGEAFVRLDSMFAKSIENAPYMVFVTPEGDTKGLYVTNKSMNGFSVRETQGGRSTLDFSYRIVATLYTRSSNRLSMVSVGRSRGLAGIRTAAARALSNPVRFGTTIAKPARNATVETPRF